jgi:EAL domain-containing protein (putative c-di-GMP-specific phosphodiesterase class I)
VRATHIDDEDLHAHRGASVARLRPLSLHASFLIHYPEAARSRIKDDLDNSSQPPRGPVRVLLVDDEEAIARGLGRLLKAAGYAVTAAHDGALALKAIETETFDVIVSDIQMPNMDGLALLRSIRGRDLDVPVVFLTGSPTIETAVEALERGAFRYLTKPIDGPEFIRVIAQADQRHRFALVRREAATETGGGPIGDLAGLDARFASAVEKMWIAMQPVVSWSSRTVQAYESLLRTDEPALRNPLDFIDAAERLGRTKELGRIIRERIAAQIPEAPADSKIFVNLHPADLVDEELCSKGGALSPFASRIVLEVTERAALDRVKGLSEGVARLRGIGYRLALDDLGAGYAGLSSFALLEPEVVKIDMSLVRAIQLSPIKQKLFRSFANLCREGGTQIIAEGVEVAEERDCLTALGGDLYQGYLFARPGRGFPTPVY